MLIAQEQGVSIRGLIEDMARNYAKSQALADLAQVAVQKDTRHVLRDSAQLLKQLEKAAYAAMQRLVDLEKCLNKAWSEPDFERYLNAVLDEMALCTDSRILAFLKTIRNHEKLLLTFLTWLQEDLPKWRATLHQQLPDPEQALAFERIIAQHWSLQQKLIAGHTQWQARAHAVALLLDAWTADSAPLHSLASQLMRIFDAAGHTNSITESLNGLLKSFLNPRQGFHGTDTMQAYLDLFVLWHNTRIFERGKRAGHSPFQLAGVETPSDDWVSLLGYYSDTRMKLKLSPCHARVLLSGIQLAQPH